MSPTQPSNNVGVILQDKDGKLKAEIGQNLERRLPTMLFREGTAPANTRKALRERLALYIDCVREAMEWLRQGDRSRALAALEKTLPPSPDLSVNSAQREPATPEVEARGIKHTDKL